MHAYSCKSLAVLLWVVFASTVFTPALGAEVVIEAWVQRYAGPGYTDDSANTLAIDNSGNVIVAGRTRSGTFTDYLIVAYSGSGVVLWTNRYNGPEDNYDEIFAVATDHNGNVFVTGHSYASGAINPDYVTIGYSGAGSPLWTNRYNGPANSGEIARAVAVDAAGNVFVTGQSAGIGTGVDFATIKYSGSGTPLWTNRYNGPANGNDSAFALAVDGSGNVIVTGDSYSGTQWDYATIKYSGSGVPLWTNRYDGPANAGDGANAVAVDAAGNVFVTGYSYGGFETKIDYATLGYSNAGVPLWTNRYNGPGSLDDRANRVAVDASGNVFVTGYSRGNGTSDDYATIKYSITGAPLWTNRYNGPGNEEDEARALAVDGSGNVFVTGYSWGGGSSLDFATIKYSSAGVRLWTNRYNGPRNGIDQANALGIDGGGDVFVTGRSSGSDETDDFATIKYTSAFTPTITDEPQSHTNVVAATAMFSVTMTGTSPFGFQWRKGDTNLGDSSSISGTATSTLTITNLALSDAGDYSVVVTNAYGSVTSAVAVLTVLKATPALTWTNPASISYGTALSSNQLNATASVPGNFAYHPPFGSVLNAGTQTLIGVFTPTDSANFNSATGSVSLLVMPAPLNVTASNAARLYGQPNPVFSGAITGLQNGDNITATFSCSASPSSLPGTYPIVAALQDPNVRLGNYLVTTNAGILTVSPPAPPTHAFSFGTTGTGPGQLRGPVGIAVDSNGNVYVADRDNHRIQKFTGAGVYLTQWGSLGTNAGQFNQPFEVAVDNNSNVFVGDTLNNRVQKFSNNGSYLLQWGSAQSLAVYGMVVGSSGDVYVADTGYHRIKKFTGSGALLAMWGSFGTNAGQLNSPRGLAVAGEGSVYVADVGNRRMQKFGIDGSYLAHWGSPGTNAGQFGNTSEGGPNGAAVDRMGNVCVGDGGNDRVTIFSSNGNYLMHFGSTGSGAGQFRDPDRLAFDPSGTLLYVSEWGNNRIQVFNYNVPPQMISTATRSGSEITLSWNAIPGRRYQVQYKADLTQPNWINLGSSFVTTNSIASAADGVVFDAQRFYRIALLP